MRDFGKHPKISLRDRLSFFAFLGVTTLVEKKMSKVLLVEDMEINRDMLARRLTRQGFDVVTAVDGKESVDAARTENPDIILMDVNLPIMDGWQATRLIRQCEQTKNIPIIALTAHALTKSRETSLDAGCDDYETKPVNFKKLVSKMEALIQHAE